ncbi:unnamed protein product [Medioppia subpectinata]|uniref:Nuclear receptor domain-containing protein n=1 Tax=Medioppia subpectinata TaxID=1979941 RepID=A0A7R9KI08_9ACAR|nr:unnamed protein product [Medioppia subpectinata]CAG2104054.1 unnamed protein product [Medioppia subpectinata]
MVDSWMCPSDGKCNINVMTRRMCRKCRLEKCLAVGMKKELIRSDDEIKRRKENKLQYKLSDESHNCIDFSANNLDIDSIISDTTIDKNFTDYNGINQLESKRIEELLNASIIFNYPLDSNASIHKIKAYDDIFNNICADDKYALMKYGGRDVALIRCLKLEQQLAINIAFIARNFGAMTCESCKSFFRRNGLKNEISNCASNGKCIINVMTRRLCTKCRLEKCLAVGMKSELIRSDEQNKCRKELIKENKSKHKTRDESQNCTIRDYNGINQLESKRISELLIASNTIFKHPLQSNAIIHRIKDWDEFADKFKDYNELFIRLIIQFTKSLNGFNNICADDKYALMKCGIRDLTFYNTNFDSNRII